MDVVTKWALGAAAGWTLLVVVMMPRRERPPASSASWRLVEGARVRLERGRRYRACVRVPWYAPTGLVRNEIPPRARERGFRDVVVSERPPVGWPHVTGGCDLFVEATWDREPETFERPSAVAFAWEAVP